SPTAHSPGAPGAESFRVHECSPWRCNGRRFAAPAARCPSARLPWPPQRGPQRGPMSIRPSALGLAMLLAAPLATVRTQQPDAQSTVEQFGQRLQSAQQQIDTAQDALAKARNEMREMQRALQRLQRHHQETVEESGRQDQRNLQELRQLRDELAQVRQELEQREGTHPAHVDEMPQQMHATQ